MNFGKRYGVRAKHQSKFRKFRSTFVQIAVDLGILDSRAAERAEELCADAEVPTSDLLVEAQLMTPEQAAKVDATRKKVDVAGHLDDKFKRASLALASTKTSAENLVKVTATKK